MILKYAFARPCDFCRGYIHKGEHWHKWSSGDNWVRACQSCDDALFDLKHTIRLITVESVVNSAALDKREFLLK